MYGGPSITVIWLHTCKFTRTYCMCKCIYMYMTNHSIRCLGSATWQKDNATYTTQLAQSKQLHVFSKNNLLPRVYIHVYIRTYMYIYINWGSHTVLWSQILELWLTYIQPWRYTDPLRPSSENKESLEALPKRWWVSESPIIYTRIHEKKPYLVGPDKLSDPWTALFRAY